MPFMRLKEAVGNGRSGADGLAQRVKGDVGEFVNLLSLANNFRARFYCHTVEKIRVGNSNIRNPILVSYVANCGYSLPC